MFANTVTSEYSIILEFGTICHTVSNHQVVVVDDDDDDDDDDDGSMVTMATAWWNIIFSEKIVNQAGNSWSNLFWLVLPQGLSSGVHWRACVCTFHARDQVA